VGVQPNGDAIGGANITGDSIGKYACAKFVVADSPGTLPITIASVSVVTKQPQIPCMVPSRVTSHDASPPE
jgi:hypothetical protein